MTFTRRLFLKVLGLVTFWRGAPSMAAQGAVDPAQPYGTEFPNLDSLAVGEWWKKARPRGANAPPPMDVPRDQVVAFALYTHDQRVLKLTAQLYPTLPLRVPVGGAIAGFVTALTTGLLFGALPARRAARLDPVAALSRR